MICFYAPAQSEEQNEWSCDREVVQGEEQVVYMWQSASCRVTSPYSVCDNAHIDDMDPLTQSNQLTVLSPYVCKIYGVLLRLHAPN